MRLIIFIGLIFISEIICAQTFHKVLNFFDVTIFPNINSREIIVFKNNTTIKTYTHIDDRTTKANNKSEYYWYYSDHINSNIGGYTGDLLHGEYCVYNRNNGLIEKGYFKKGRKSGVWKKWNSTGSLTELMKWRKGIRQGRYLQYNEEGDVKTKARHKRNFLSGRYQIYQNNITETKKYRKGKEMAPEDYLLSKIKTKISSGSKSDLEEEKAKQQQQQQQ